MPSFIILAWYDLVAKFWSCAAIIRPSASAFSPVLLSHLLVLFWSTFASLVLFGYLPWSAFSSQCFDNLSWALCFVFCFILFAYAVVCSLSPFSRLGTSSSCLNVSPSFWMEYNFFLFSCSHTSWGRVSSECFKYVSNPTVVVLKAIFISSSPRCYG